MKNLMACLIVFVIGLSGCRGTDACTPNETRCNGNSAEICDSEQRWGAFMDCDQVGRYNAGTWVCAKPEQDAGVTCLPVDGGAQ